MKVYRENLVRNQIVRDRNTRAGQLRFQALLNQLEEEQTNWVTRENMDSKINAALFATPCTTGLVTKNSHLWRLHTITMNINREISAELKEEYSDVGDQASVKSALQLKLDSKAYVHDFLEPMIGTGEDRANMKQLVREFSQSFAGLDANDDRFDFYLEVSF